MARELLVAMESADGDGPHRVALPIVRTRLRRERGLGLGFVYHALVDTGAMFTVASLPVTDDLKLDLATVKTSLDRVPLTGPNGDLGAGWGWDFELQLGDGSSASSRIVLTGARVYFAEWDLAGFDLVLGQHDALGRLAFCQDNYGKEPCFTLRAPTRR